jgi:hypothetical protein
MTTTVAIPFGVAMAMSLWSRTLGARKSMSRSGPKMVGGTA